jgi:hypothetical protein
MLVLGLAAPAAAQTAGEPRAALAQAERARVLQALTGDRRVQAIVGAQPRTILGEPIFNKTEIERYSRTEDAPAPTRQIPAILFNPTTNRAARAVATADGRIVSVEPMAAVLVPIMPEDASLALDLVRRSGGNRIPNLDRFTAEAAGGGSRADNVAELLPLRSMASSDPCSRDRCVDVLFRTPDGYLPVRAHVDLTKRTVQMQGRGR